MSTGSYLPASNTPWTQLDEKMCSHPDHIPDTVMMYVPPGRTYEYKCPGCGHVTRVSSPVIMSCDE